jgi:hypothetical protein
MMRLYEDAGVDLSRPIDPRVRLPFGDILELYFSGANNRAYTLQRLKDLASGQLTNFRWDSGTSCLTAGGSQTDKRWSADLPTDAQLIADVFASFLNGASVVPTTKFLIRSNEKRPEGEHVALLQSRRNPPHFEVSIKNAKFNALHQNSSAMPVHPGLPF